MPASIRCRFRQRLPKRTVRRAMKARCACAKSWRAIAPSSNGRWRWMRSRRMPSAGNSYFSPGFRTGPIRWKKRWRAAPPEAAKLFRRLAMAEPRVELVDQLLGGVGNDRARREDCLGAGLEQRIIILRRHHAADDDHDVLAAVLLRRRLQLRARGE